MVKPLIMDDLYDRVATTEFGREVWLEFRNGDRFRCNEYEGTPEEGD